MHVGSGVCWEQRASQCICQWEQGGRKGGDGEESGLKGGFFQVGSQRQVYLLQMHTATKTGNRVCRSGKGTFTTSPLSFSSMNGILFLMCIIRRGTSGHGKGTFSLLIDHRHTELFVALTVSLFSLFFKANAATINCH